MNRVHAQVHDVTADEIIVGQSDVNAWVSLVTHAAILHPYGQGRAEQLRTLIAVGQAIVDQATALLPEAEDPCSDDEANE